MSSGILLVPRRMKTVGRFTAPDPWNGNAPAEFTIEAYRLFNSGTRVLRDTRGLGLAYLYGISSEIDGADRILPEALAELWRRGEVAPEKLPSMLAQVAPALKPEDYRVWIGTKLHWWYLGAVALVLLGTIWFIARAWPKEGWDVAGLPRDMKLADWLNTPMRVGHDVRVRDQFPTPAGMQRARGLRPPEIYRELQEDHEHLLIWLKDARGHRLLIKRASDYDPRAAIVPDGIVVPTKEIGLDDATGKALAESVPGLDVDTALWNGLYQPKAGSRQTVQFLAGFEVIILLIFLITGAIVMRRVGIRKRQMREWTPLAQTPVGTVLVADATEGHRIQYDFAPPTEPEASPQHGTIAPQADEVSMKVGNTTIGLGDINVVEAFYNTTSYRLEPEGWGTRFPVLMDELFEGRVSASSAIRALKELDVVERELSELPRKKVIWDVHDRRPMEDTFLRVNHDATNLRDYFVRSDGTPMVDAIRQALETARRTGQTVTIRGGLHGLKSIKGLAVVGFGLLFALVVGLFFPNAILGARSGPRGSGALLWPFGLLTAFGGVLMLLAARYPSLMAWARRRYPVVIIAAIALLVGFLSLTWRTPPKPPLTPLPKLVPAPVPKFTPPTRPVIPRPTTRG